MSNNYRNGKTHTYLRRGYETLKEYMGERANQKWYKYCGQETQKEMVHTFKKVSRISPTQPEVSLPLPVLAW